MLRVSTIAFLQQSLDQHDCLSMAISRIGGMQYSAYMILATFLLDNPWKTPAERGLPQGAYGDLRVEGRILSSFPD